AQAMWDEYDADLKAIDADIAKKTEDLRRQEAAAAAAGKSGSAVNGSGSLMWPGTSNVVTSLYGTREHPVHKVLLTHHGIDLRAAYGSKIYAADSGTVITAAYSSSYGNYIVIDHGSSGMTTLYAHMSKLNVKNGQAVTKGDVVGYAGSTGTATATHLHFEVAVNGERQNPLNYFSGGYVIKDGA
nr:M23 family metallopeptidase [Clostridiales bacterium]